MFRPQLYGVSSRSLYTMDFFKEGTHEDLRVQILIYHGGLKGGNRRSIDFGFNRLEIERGREPAGFHGPNILVIKERQN